MSDELLRIAKLLRPGLEHLPLAGDGWHVFSMHVRRDADGQILVCGMALVDARAVTGMTGTPAEMQFLIDENCRLNRRLLEALYPDE